MKRAVIRYTLDRSQLSSLNDTFSKLVPGIDLLQVGWPTSRGVAIYEFTYEKELGRLLPNRGDFDLFRFIPLQSYTPENFFQTISRVETINMICLSYPLQVVKDQNIAQYLPPGVQSRFMWFYDYPAMITDLAESLIVNVRPSASILALDPRKFSFENDEEYQVDCLGMAGFEQLSERVRNEWSKRKHI